MYLQNLTQRDYPVYKTNKELQQLAKDLTYHLDDHDKISHPYEKWSEQQIICRLNILSLLLQSIVNCRTKLCMSGELFQDPNLLKCLQSYYLPITRAQLFLKGFFTPTASNNWNPKFKEPIFTNAPCSRLQECLAKHTRY